MSHLILIDGNNLGFAGMANPKLNAGDKATQGTFTFIKMIRNIFLDNPEALIMVLWDGRSWRKDIYDKYKAKREETQKQQQARAEYFDQKRDMVKALKQLGVIQCIADNMEADDLAEIYSRTWTGDRVTLISGDKDWLQLVDERTSWYDPIIVRGCNHKNFPAMTGFKDSEQFVDAKCVLGDKDEVPGIKGVGQKTLEKVYDIYPSFKEFILASQPGVRWLMHHRSNVPKILVQLLSDKTKTMERLVFNRKLADLKTPERPEPKGLKRIQSSLNAEAFQDFCYENAFLSFTKDFEKFLKPFKDNKYVRV